MVSVPWLLQRELDWQTSVSERDLTQVLLRRMRAQHLDADDIDLQRLMCGLAKGYVEVAKTSRVLPDSELINSIAVEAAEWIADDEVLDTVLALKLGKRQVRCEARKLDGVLRDMIAREVSRLLLQSVSSASRNRKRRSAA